TGAAPRSRRARFRPRPRLARRRQPRGPYPRRRSLVVGADRRVPAVIPGGVGEWWRGIPSVTAMVGCGGSEHRLRWHDGTLVAEDHDIDAERAITGLGGEVPHCLAVLAAWRA